MVVCSFFCMVLFAVEITMFKGICSCICMLLVLLLCVDVELGLDVIELSSE